VNGTVSKLVEGQWGPLVHALVRAYERGDAAALTGILKKFESENESELRREITALTDALRSGLDRLGRNEALARMAQQDMPDARARLEYVVKLTEDGAHRTLDLVERSLPIADRIRMSADEIANALDVGQACGADSEGKSPSLSDITETLRTTTKECQAIRAHLVEVVMTQAYQDISGQIIRGVIAVVGELESALGELMRICGHEQKPSATRGSVTRGFGPVIPGVNEGLTEQQDVDAIIANLGI
jgi:chemotaxis protein CheZ